jgi:peptidyl-prolyl cis-trans isomerase D
MERYMSDGFQKRSSQIFLGIFIGVIIISFMFTGPMGGTGTPDSIGSVGGHDIKIREFNNEVQRQSQFYSQFMKGGQPLSSSEMKQFKVYDNAIKNLVMNKLRIILADEVGFVASKSEIVEDIKKASYFQTGKQFDINRYKSLLAYNKITPEDFEEETGNRLKSMQLQEVMRNVYFSTDMKKKLNELYNDKREATIVTLNFNELRKTLNITDKEVKDFLAKENNKKKVESIFNQRKPSLDKKEEVKVRHILFASQKDGSDLKKAKDLRAKVTKKNFVKLAKKHTDEPAGKKSGGDLKWVKRGEMVKEFEAAAFAMKKGEISQPVKTKFGHHIIYVEDRKEAKEAKLADFENKIATELIQKDKDIKDLTKKAKEEIVAAMDAKKSLKKLADKYRISIKEKVAVNKLEGLGQNYSIKDEDVAKIFKTNEKTLSFDEALKTTFIFATAKGMDEKKDFNLGSATSMASQSALKTMLDNLSKKYSFQQNKYARLPN